jgi:C1A family cysteine protease
MIRFTLKQDPEDFRDLLWAKGSTDPAARTDLRGIASAVEDQQTIGSCTGQAIVGIREAMLNKSKSKFIDLSRLFTYQMEQIMEGSFGLDAGACIRDGIKVQVKTGICTERLWPYDVSKLKVMPPQECYEDAAKRKIKRYVRLKTLSDVKECLTLGFPCVFGIRIFSSFMSESVSRTGNVPIPGWFDSKLGGHALAIFGHNDQTQKIIFRNSWGAGWGDSGYGYLPYKYFNKYASDIWAILE